MCLHSPATAAAISRYLLPAGPTAANPPHATAVGEWDRQTDGHCTVLQTAPCKLCGQCQQCTTLLPVTVPNA